MGKNRDSSTEDEVVIDSSEPVPQKKHKKHKHKKHKKKRCLDESEDTQDLVIDDAAPFRLKLKLPKDSLLLSSSEKLKDRVTPSKLGEKTSTNANASPKTSKKRRIRGKDSGTSSEEERWLDAIESGKLEEVDDELKKIKPKDPKLMTARQRAMFERKSDKDGSPGGEQLLALPSGYKEKVMTVEAIQKAALKSQKRKQQADEKREKDKKKTMERLLRKQDSKSGKSSKMRSTRMSYPRITYRSTAEGVTISLPIGLDFPLPTMPLKSLQPRNLQCGVSGCASPKKYTCSKTNIPLCSLNCYRKNLTGKGLI